MRAHDEQCFYSVGGMHILYLQHCPSLNRCLSFPYRAILVSMIVPRNCFCNTCMAILRIDTSGLPPL